MKKILFLFVLGLFSTSCDEDVTGLSVNSDSNTKMAYIENGPINDLSTLPEMILQHVVYNYPEQQISDASRNENGYEIALSSGDRLIFNVNGDFLFAEEVEPETTTLASHLGYTEVENIELLPDRLLQYLVYNYADVPVDLALKSASGYKVILATAVELNFDLEGKFLFYTDEN